MFSNATDLKVQYSYFSASDGQETIELFWLRFTRNRFNFCKPTIKESK